MLKDNIFISRDSFTDIYSFETFLSNIDKLYNTSDIIIDMEAVNFFDPYTLNCFLLAGRNYLRRTASKIQLRKINPVLLSYFERMNFLHKDIFSIIETNVVIKKLQRSQASNNLIEITDIPNRERDSVKIISSVVTLFRQRSALLLKNNNNSNTTDNFITVISEICQNVFEHSMDSGFFSAQSYSRQNNNVTHISIADSGIGIQGSLGESGKFPNDKGSILLLKALTTPISSKREFGYGLCRINSLIEEMGGNLYLRSGDSSVTVMNTGKRYSFTRDNIPYFDGTQISFMIIS